MEIFLFYYISVADSNLLAIQGSKSISVIRNRIILKENCYQKIKKKMNHEDPVLWIRNRMDPAKSERA